MVAHVEGVDERRAAAEARVSMLYRQARITAADKASALYVLPFLCEGLLMLTGARFNLAYHYGIPIIYSRYCRVLRGDGVCTNTSWSCGCVESETT
jgi:hypothetical protein